MWHTTDDKQKEIEHGIRRLIVSMCSERLLGRLRLKRRMGKEPRQHPKLRFQNILHALPFRAIAASSRLAAVAEEQRALFVERAREIITLIDAYTNHPRLEQLESLVDGFYRLRQLDCQALLNTIPDDRIAESNRKSTLNMIHKVARYTEAARFLLRTCKKLPITRRMQVVVVGLPDVAFFRAPVDPQYKVGVSSMLSRLRAPERTKHIEQKRQSDTLCRLLGTTPNKADDDLTKQAHRTHMTGKIHAEVQLVFSYEISEQSKASNNRLSPPRVVCSSKKACFLCDLFIKMHGKMRTPWSHGKLYPGWRVPDCPGLDLRLRFNHLLEHRIRESIALLFERRERTAYPGPSESTLITLPSLASESESIFFAKGESKVELSQIPAQGIETTSQNDSNDAMGVSRGPRSSFGPLASVGDPTSVPAGSSKEANEDSKADSESQHTPSNLSCRIKRTAGRDSQQAKHAVQDTPPFAELKKESQSAQPPSSSNDSNHVDGVKHDDDVTESVTESVDGPDIFKDAIKSPDLKDRSCEDGDNAAEDYHHLRQGQKVSHIIYPDHAKTFFTRALVVQFEYSTGPSLKVPAGKPPRKLPFTIDRLGVDEIVRLKDDESISFGNADALIGEVPLVLPSMESLYVAASGVVFKITFH